MNEKNTPPHQLFKKTDKESNWCGGKTLNDKDSYLDIQRERKVTILEVLDRVLDKGAVISGDIVISVADVDLIYLGLKVLLSSVETMERLRGAPIEGPMQEPT